MHIEVNARMSKLLALMILFCELTCLATAGDEAINTHMSFLLDSITVGYDRRLPPHNGKDKADGCVEIFMEIYINSMSSVSETNMDYSMTMFLREKWMDERLAFKHALNLSRMEMDSSFIDKIWRPDVYIVNEKQAWTHDVTVPNQMIHIYPNGEVQMSMRVTGSFSCSMDLLKYPFDTQECFMELESYAHSTDQLIFTWTQEPIKIADGITFPQFELTETSQYTCTREYYGINFPCIGIKFLLQRRYAYYIIQIYLPSSMIVFLSWVSFWLDANAVPARISLGLLTVLTMETQSANARENLPPVSSIKGIDVWMASCLAFVFMALIEFAYVNVQSRVTNRRQSMFQSNNITLEAGKNFNMREVPLDIDKDPCCDCFKRLSGLERARFVDKVSRVLFPSAFLCFNVAYWIFYLMWKHDTPRLV